ncbi:hypothetical protein F511_41082 [Dorcoceras hygrometricum]|uniref:Uncharacterized protein n=1 Tax=Dorcoceras hygrometricum TaxID=472368 RepID=A0A2Z7CHU7_9LAMI|nr:hypothetical protein F511_41082 [Dorcoceras hygrometricum]
MEGLIPFVYRAIMQYRSGRPGVIGTWLDESSPEGYVRLPGDSDRSSTIDTSVFRSDCVLSTRICVSNNATQSPIPHCSVDSLRAI